MNTRTLAGSSLMVLGMVFLLGAARGGCGAGLDNRAGEPGLDVGGSSGASWQVHYEDTLEVEVRNAGGIIAAGTYTMAAGGTLELEGVSVDISELCARDDVACPSEVFPAEVTMIQPGSELHLLYVTFSKEGPLGKLSQATLLGNVDSDDDFSVALGVGAAAAGTCGLLGVSYVIGHIFEDGVVPDRGDYLEGKIVTAYSGGCILAGQGGALGAGLTVEFRVPFSADRR